MPFISFIIDVLCITRTSLMMQWIARRHYAEDRVSLMHSVIYCRFRKCPTNHWTPQNMQDNNIIKYFGPNSPFSHLHPNELKVFDDTWTTVEQLYQYAKAILGNDICVAEQIKAEPDGKGQKRLSHRITSKHPHLWTLLKRSIMVRLDFEKFTQHEALQKILLSTDKKIIIENNPRDEYWGGRRNEAGKVLMEIRCKLKGQNKPMPQIIITGDSILSSMDARHFEKQLGKTVQIFSLPGARMEYITQAVKFTCGRFIEKLIIFGGTNDLTTKDDKPRYGPNKLFRKIQYFEKEFHLWCPSTKLYICHILNRPRCKNSRVESHINWYNYMLDSANWAGDTEVISIEDIPENEFRDGLHLLPKNIGRLEQAFIGNLMK